MAGMMSARERVILYWCLMSVALVLFMNGVITPLQAKSDRLSRELEESQNKMRQDLAVINKGESYQSRVETYRRFYGRDGSEEESVTSVLTEIEETAAAAGLAITDLKPGKVESGNDDLKNFTVSLTVKGSLEEGLRFLYELQREPHHFAVEAMDIEKPLRASSGQLSARIVLRKPFILIKNDPPPGAGSRNRIVSKGV